MIILLATLGAVFLTTFLAAPTMGAGWFWDAGNGLGFAAFGGLLYIGITSCKRPDIRAHQILGYTVLFVAVTHALWFLLGDATVCTVVAQSEGQLSRVDLSEAGDRIHGHRMLD